MAKDKYSITVNTFNKLAKKYQDKYMDFAFYHDTYDAFCDLVTLDGAKIFEIGCGPGNISKYLLAKRADYQLFGIDLAENMIALAKQNNPSADFAVMDSRDISQVNDNFDAILCGFCTPYLAKDDVAKLIANARKLLKPEGTFHLSTMEGDDIRSGFQTSNAGDQVYIHYHQFAFLAQHLARNNFEIIKVIRKDFPVEQGEATTDIFIYAKAI